MSPAPFVANPDDSPLLHQPSQNPNHRQHHMRPRINKSRPPRRASMAWPQQPPHKHHRHRDNRNGEEGVEVAGAGGGHCARLVG